MNRSVKPTVRQLNLPLFNNPSLPITDSKQKELATALAELLISGFRQAVKAPGMGGPSEPETDN